MPDIDVNFEEAQPINVNIEEAQPINVTLAEAVNYYGAGLVQSVNGQQGDVVLDAGDVGADPAGSASSALSSANSYTDSAIGSIDYPVDSVNSKTGTVVLNADDISDTTTAHKFVTAADITKLANTSGVNTGDQDLSGYATTASLATVATTGSYADLTNKPSIPNELTDLDTTVTGAQLNAIKTKIDTVETGADVTDTANVTAAGALMDSEVENLAAVKSFDPADYATAAQGSLASSSLQPGDNISDLTNDSDYQTGAEVASSISAIDFPVDSVSGKTGAVTLVKADVGLNNVDNTSDLNKPISIAAQAALDDKLENITGLVTAGTNVTISGAGTDSSPYQISAAGGGGGGSVDSVNGQTGVVVLDYTDVGADAAGDAATAESNANDYTDTAIAAIDYPVDSVNGSTGTVVLDADDISDTSTLHKFTTASDISKLAGIEAGAEVNNISDTNATDLTDGGDSTLHFHSSDRNRANHIGTQTASTISDFQTTVSSNTDVAANTAARHEAVTVTDSSEIDFTLTGQNITASLVASSIDESKLDASVNASLDLADSAVQQSSGSVADNAIARYDLTTGRLIQNSSASIDDNGTATANALHLSTTPTGTHTAAGQLSYNGTDRTWDAAVGNGVIANLAEELWTMVQNDTGSTITEGTVCQFIGTIGASGNIRVKPAVLSEITSPRLLIGIATENIINGSRGKVTRFGVVRGLNTSGMTTGAAIYLSSTAGQFTTTAPVAPNKAWALGVVTAVHATVGTVQVNTFNMPPKLDDLADVNGTTPTSGSFLVYNSANAYHDFTGNINDLVTKTGAETLTNKSLVDLSTFIVDDADATKKGQFQLSGVTTGTTRTVLFPNSNGTMYVTSGTDVSVADGGTGRSTSTTAYGVIAAGTTATGAHQTISPGTSGQFLKSNGASALGSFANIAQSDVTNLVTDLAAKQAASVIAANGMGVVVHGATASTARPTGFAQVMWIGSVDPTNKITNDLWVDTA